MNFINKQIFPWHFETRVPQLLSNVGNAMIIMSTSLLVIIHSASRSHVHIRTTTDECICRHYVLSYSIKPKTRPDSDRFYVRSKVSNYITDVIITIPYAWTNLSTFGGSTMMMMMMSVMTRSNCLALLKSGVRLGFCQMFI